MYALYRNPLERHLVGDADVAGTSHVRAGHIVVYIRCLAALHESI